MLVGARLRHIAGMKWGTRGYLDMDRLLELPEKEESVTTGSHATTNRTATAS
jgi:putative transposase